MVTILSTTIALLIGLAEGALIGSVLMYDKAVKVRREENGELVSAVRCRDCKWYGHIGCAIEIKDDSDRPKPDDFCSFGERRTK